MSNKKFIFLITAVMMILPGAVWALGEKKASLEFLPAPNIENTTIKLSEICDVQCEDPYLLEKLKAVTLGTVPEPGTEKTLSKYEVIASLRREGISARDISFRGKAQLRFSYQSEQLRPEEVVAAAKEYILKESGYSPEDIIFEVIKQPRALLIPEGGAHFEVYPLSCAGFIGNTFLSVNVIVDEKIVETVPVTIHVRVFKPVLVVKERIERGERVSESAFMLRRREVTRYSKGVIESFNEIKGMVSKRLLRSSQIISMNMFEEPELVKKGDIVKVLLSSGALTVKAKGIALNNAKKGEVLRVKNIDSKRIISTIVDSDGTARLSI